METPNTQQLQPQTLNTLNSFLNTWNQDPLAATNSLVITGNQITILNDSDVLLSLTIPIGTEIENLTQELEKEQDSLEDLFPDINLNNLISPIENTNEEFISPLQEEPEVFNEENLEEVSSLKETGNQLPLNNILAKLIDDLTTEKEEVFTRITPLIEITYKEKLKEIISRLKVESRGRQRDQHIKTLEACYYLGQLRENSKENRQRIKYTRNTLKKSLEPRRADRIWKCAERAYKVFQICGLHRLCSTTKITFSNLEEISDEDFTELLESVEIRSAHF